MKNGRPKGFGDDHYSEEGVTKQMLEEYLSYDAESGFVIWKKAYHTRRNGMRAGGVDKMSYRRVGALNRVFMEHRLIWCLVHGEWPPCDVDHVNGVRDDNRLANLRLADKSQNQANRKKLTTNTTGRRGVSMHKHCGKWISRIRVSGKLVHLGYFTDLDAAGNAYDEAAKKYFGDYASEASK